MLAPCQPRPVAPPWYRSRTARQALVHLWLKDLLMGAPPKFAVSRSSSAVRWIHKRKCTLRRSIQARRAGHCDRQLRRTTLQGCHASRWRADATHTTLASACSEPWDWASSGWRAARTSTCSWPCERRQTYRCSEDVAELAVCAPALRAGILNAKRATSIEALCTSVGGAPARLC